MIVSRAGTHAYDRIPLPTDGSAPPNWPPNTRWTSPTSSARRSTRCSQTGRAERALGLRGRGTGSSRRGGARRGGRTGRRARRPRRAAPPPRRAERGDRRRRRREHDRARGQADDRPDARRRRRGRRRRLRSRYESGRSLRCRSDPGSVVGARVPRNDVVERDARARPVGVVGGHDVVAVDRSVAGHTAESVVHYARAAVGRTAVSVAQFGQRWRTV